MNIIEIFKIADNSYKFDKFDQTKYYVYISVFLLFLVIIYTGIIFVLDSYKPNELVPYPTNEDCILNFDLAIITPTTMKFFYDYLENSE